MEDSPREDRCKGKSRYVLREEGLKNPFSD